MLRIRKTSMILWIYAFFAKLLFVRGMFVKQAATHIEQVLATRIVRTLASRIRMQ